MKKFFTLIFILSAIIVQAQQKTGTVIGRVLQSKDKSPIDYASIALKNTVDSSVVGATSTDDKGKFIFKNLKPGSYRLYAAFIGLKNVNKDFSVTANNLDINLGDIILEGGAIDLQTVEIRAEAPPIVVKKDTIEFNASSFKVVENAVVEDLLKKLPGVEVDKSGAVKAQGETVTKVKVDGKEFFGGDPLLATKNLPADMIDKIQIIDELSDQAQFTGIDDGTRTKIINITTRKDKKKGYFGNSSVGYGTDGRYNVNLNVNKFKNEQQMSFIGQFNNSNQQNFGGGLGGNGGNGGRSGSSGITNTTAFGLNFADTYTDGTEISGSYFYNKTNNQTSRSTVTQNLLGNEITIFKNKQDNSSSRFNNRINFMVDTKIDSLTSIKIQPSINYTDNESLNISTYNRDYNTSTVNGSQSLSTHNTTPNINNNILLRRKFMRRGRTLSYNLNTGFNDNGGNNYNKTNDIITRGTVTNNILDQFVDQESNSVNVVNRVVYTEPLSKTISFELNYRNSYNRNTSDRFTYDFNPQTLEYDLINTKYSNSYENTILTNTAGFSFTKMGKKFNLNVGLAMQNTDRTNDNISKGYVLKQNVNNYTPSAMFRYNFSNSKKFVVNYRGSTTQPTIQQLQPILNNTNTQSVPVGNPDLKPEFSNSLRVAYNTFTVGKNRSLFVNLTLNQTSNKIANSSKLILSGDDEGKLAVMPVNVNGVYSGNLASTLSLPLMPENKLNFHINVGGTYNRDVNFTNTLKNITNSWSISNGYRLVSNLDKLDLTAGISASINKATYSVQTAANAQFYNFSPNISASYLFPANIRLSADADYNARLGRGQGSDVKYTLMNAYISKQFFNNRGTFKAAVNDILNQNKGVSRTIDNNTIQDVTYNVLTRYFMFSFTYSLRQFGAKNRNKTNEDGGNRRNSGGGGFGGGGRRN